MKYLMTRNLLSEGPQIHCGSDYNISTFWHCDNRFNSNDNTVSLPNINFLR